MNPTSLRAPAAPAAFLTLPALTLLVLTSFAATPALAQREDKGLQMNCAGDYFKLCAGADPDSPERSAASRANRAVSRPQCRRRSPRYDRKSVSKDPTTRALSDDVDAGSSKTCGTTEDLESFAIATRS